ncbi:hypothetical protein M422DRAFT_50957 [Sphaerobolus stellatus SS14]|uniref:BTB domain-containing protein n=1 Tax=Sphaerobolus stellatus (strain SS14) TaxID=990650 RepID=A0A0C9V4J1_SPHS4|nr:hypothetical protein M422DRAFT_50957 [Sphaerobolus stellatus SS14]
MATLLNVPQMQLELAFPIESCLKRQYDSDSEVTPVKSPKRPRTGDVLRSPRATSSSTQLKWDKDYVFSSGDLILIARNTTFKVHSDLVALPGSAFHDRFKHRKEPGGEHIPLAYTLDISPLHLRHFFWALYNPAYIVQPAVSPRNLELDVMLNISNVAHGFKYPDLDTWALDAVEAYFDAMDHERFLSQAVARLERAVKRAALSHHDGLRSCIVNRWKALLEAGLVPPNTVVTFADRCSLHDLRAVAFYHILTKGEHVWSAVGYLDWYHLVDLQSGRRRLHAFWKETKQQLLDLDAHIPHRCNPLLERLPLWVDILKKVESNTILDDPLHKLHAIATILEKRKIASNMRCTL